MKSNNQIINFFLMFLLFCSCNRNNQVEFWEEIAGGVWIYKTSPEDQITPLKAAGSCPDFMRINEFGPAHFPFRKEEIKVFTQYGKFYLRFSLQKDEQIYGLGLQFKSVNQRGKIYELRVDHYGGTDNGRTHAPVPFYVSSNGYGVLINSPQVIKIYVGTTVRTDSPNQPEIYDRNTDKNWTSMPESDAIEVMVPGANTEIVVFRGNSPMEVVQKYNLFCGGGCLPPKWGLGFTYRTHTLYTSEDVIKEVYSFEEQGFPLDFIGLEPGWQSMSYPCSYEWDKGRFPDPERFVAELLRKKVRVNLWMNPYISPRATLYKDMIAYAGSHSVWNGIVPDYTLEEARETFNRFYEKHQLSIGVSGLKIDECDGYDRWLWPDMATFPSGTDAVEMRQVYGLLLQDMVTGLYKKNNTRTWGLTRASNAGGQRFPFVIYNDYYRHEDFITALINSGFSGILWTPEVRSSATGEEWLRRMQSVCFSPMAMINAWSSGTKPWSFPEVYDEVKSIALLRMQLLPYIYSSFADYHFNGTPLIRPMPLYPGFFRQQETTGGTLDDTKNPYNEMLRKDITDQYLFGENILVAPVFTGQNSRKVIFPPGKWYDFYSGKLAGENEVIEISAKLDQIPLFVKDGGIIPMIPPVLHAPGPGDKLPLEIRHYGLSPGRFLLYDDDGESYDYEKGYYSWTELTVDKGMESRLSGHIKRLEGDIFSYSGITWQFMSSQEP